MLDFIPVPKHGWHAEQPLVQVIAQLRFDRQGALATHAGASRMHDEIADRYPRLLSEQQQSTTAVASGPATTPAIPQWRMTNPDNTSSCVVGPEQLTLEGTTITSLESLLRMLTKTLRALSKVANPRIRERIELRFVIEIAPGPDGSHKGRIRSEFLGPAGIDSWRPELAVSTGQIILREDRL
jgi:uncharacterized protein (TIGR04255 family)